MTFWAASGFLWQHLASFIKNKIKQSKNKAICYHILVFTVLKEQRVASSQKIHQGRCFTFIKGQRDNCLFSKMNLPVLYIPCVLVTRSYFVIIRMKNYLQNRLRPSNGILHCFCLTTLTIQDYRPSSLVSSLEVISYDSFC